jgi:hypothetical protein
MIGMNVAGNPPPLPLTDEAMKLAAALLQIAVDPVLTRERLEQLNQATQAYRAAIEEHASVAARAAEVTAAQEALATRERAVAEREDGLIQEQTRLRVASDANASRQQALDARAQVLDRRQGEIEAKEKSLADRLAAYRQALA